MVLKPEPLFAAVERIARERGTPDAVVLTVPDGERFTHRDAERLSGFEHVVMLCGRYEGVDERVRRHLATEELSIGDYVLSGGELPALVIVDAVARLVPGVVGDEESVARDTFVARAAGLPAVHAAGGVPGLEVPPVLLSGHHAAIARWRRREALARTLERRPDCWSAAPTRGSRRSRRVLLEIRDVEA